MINVRIKQFDNDNAARDLWQLLEGIRNRFNNCIRQNHDTIGLLYISSLIITPSAIYNGIKLIDKIRTIVGLSPKNFICILRTAAPSNFPGKMHILQRLSLNLLRNQCYITVYNKKTSFLNHAKFILYYQICYSENIVYHGRYFGSTNLTLHGLAYRVQRNRIVGNYEEYAMYQIRPKLQLSDGDQFYLNEALDIIKHKSKLYTSSNYLREYLSDHLRYLQSIIEQSKRIISGTTLGELYSSHIDLAIALIQTYSLMEEVPGKKLTEKIISKLMEIEPPPNIFELEALIPFNIRQSEELARALEVRKDELYRINKKYINNLKEYYNIIKEEYIPKTREILNYLDKGEKSFLELLKYHNEYHIPRLSKHSVE